MKSSSYQDMAIEKNRPSGTKILIDHRSNFKKSFYFVVFHLKKEL